MITYRSSNSGALQAAYSGTVRVGYIETRKFGRWLWQLSLIRPGGGCYMGFEDDEAAAKEELEKAFAHWIESAALQLTPPVVYSPPTTKRKKKETKHDDKRDKNGDGCRAKAHPARRQRGRTAPA